MSPASAGARTPRGVTASSTRACWPRSPRRCTSMPPARCSGSASAKRRRTRGRFMAAGWRDAADAVRAAAARLTHPIGAALLGDLLVGEGWAALHDLAAALARDDEPAALEAARRLTRLGHSSGWDLLAGFVAGARG